MQDIYTTYTLTDCLLEKLNCFGTDVRTFNDSVQYIYNTDSRRFISQEDTRTILKDYFLSIKYSNKYDFENIKLRSGTLIFKEDAEASLKETRYTQKQYRYFHNFYAITVPSILQTIINTDDDMEKSSLIAAHTEIIDKENFDEENAKINMKFDELCNFVITQTIYTPDDFYTHLLSNMFSLYFCHYASLDDTEHINKLFEVIHITGNAKNKSFIKRMKPDKTKFYDRVFDLSRTDKYDTLYYYYLSFYKTYQDGRFMTGILKKNILPFFVMLVKDKYTEIKDLRPEYIDKYRTLYNSLKDKSGYPFDSYCAVAEMTLQKSKLSNSDLLELCKQNKPLVTECLNSDRFRNCYWGFVNLREDFYPYLMIDYSALSPSQQADYWKLLADYLNNSKFTQKTIRYKIGTFMKLEPMMYDIGVLSRNLVGLLNHNAEMALLEMCIG